MQSISRVITLHEILGVSNGSWIPVPSKLGEILDRSVLLGRSLSHLGCDVVRRMQRRAQRSGIQQLTTAPHKQEIHAIQSGYHISPAMLYALPYRPGPAICPAMSNLPHYAETRISTRASTCAD